jgi:hypothetical protein
MNAASAPPTAGSRRDVVIARPLQDPFLAGTQPCSLAGPGAATTATTGLRRSATDPEQAADLPRTTPDLPGHREVGAYGGNVLKHLPSDAWQYVRSAPGTYLWLALLLVTTIALRLMPSDRAQRVLIRNSTNLSRLRTAPLRVLVTSSFLIAEAGWWFYAIVYSVFHAPAEHWLGTWRWLAVAAISHVGATLLSQGYVALEIKRGRLPESMKDVDDYGVSYALAGSAAVLTFQVDSPWRYGYLTIVLLYYTIGLARTRDFTGVGHLCAVLLGLSCFWLIP